MYIDIDIHIRIYSSSSVDGGARPRGKELCIIRGSRRRREGTEGSHRVVRLRVDKSEKIERGLSLSRSLCAALTPLLMPPGSESRAETRTHSM